MAKIKEDMLKNCIQSYLGKLGFSGQAWVATEVIGSSTKDWESYEQELNDCKEKLSNCKNKAILGEEVSSFKDKVLDFYILLCGAIKKIESSHLIPKSNGVTITGLSISLGFFNADVKIDPKIFEDRKTYVNEQIDYLSKTIQEVENPNIFSMIQAFGGKLHLI
jgi:hypothetical protein